MKIRLHSVRRRASHHTALIMILLCAIMSSLISPSLSRPSTAYAQTNSGLALWLKFDEGVGATTFADASGSNAAGSCTGAACPTTGVEGRIGQSGQFDGVDDRVQATVNVPAAAFSLAAWVRYTGATWGNWRTIIEFGDDAPWFGVTPSGQLTLYSAASGGMVPIGQWAHVAYVWTGNEGRLYLNGQAVQTNTIAPVVTGQGVGIGSEIGSTTPSPWQGLIDDARVYSKALTAAEVSELANPQAGPAPQPVPPPVDTGNANVRLFDLTMSIYKPVTTPTERKPYEDLFNLFADAIYEMTNGAHKIRNVTIYDNGRFADRADIRWIQFEQQPRASVSAYGKGRGTVFMGDAIFDQNTLITNPDSLSVFVQTLTHEWGHYFYGVGDEYTQQAGDVLPNPCSVMCAAGGALDYSKLNFSTRKSTVLAGRTNNPHYREYAASGWETINRSPNDDPAPVRGRRLYWPDLGRVAPGAADDPSLELPANQTAARNVLVINWADANLTARKYRVLLLDVSADMGNDNKLASAKVALKNYVDASNVNDRIGIITFAETHTVVQPLTVIEGEASKNAIKAQIDSITAQVGVSARNVAAADQAALDALKNAPDFGLITDRGVYTILDGGFTDTTEPHIFQKVYNDHSAAGIPISVFNFAAEKKPNDPFGNALDLLQFSTTAAQPPGTYQFVGTGGFTLPPLQGRQLRQPSAKSEADKLLDALDNADQNYSPLLDVNLGSAQEVEVSSGEPFTSTIYVDGTLDELEVTVLHDGAASAAQVTLFDPNGDEVSVSDTYADEAESIYSFNIVSPTVGTWEIQVEAVGSPIFATYQATGYAYEGTTVQATLNAVGGGIVTYPEEAVLVASLESDEAIARANATAWVEKPDGDFVDILFKDDGVAPDETVDDGLYSAYLPYDAPGDYHVTIVFDNLDNKAVFTQGGEADGAETFKPVAGDFDRFATLQVLVQDVANDDHGNADSSATDLLPNNSDRAGQIDQSGDKDLFRVTSPVADPTDPKALVTSSTTHLPLVTTRFALRITHFGQGMNATVRVTTRAGTKTYETGALGFNQYWSQPVDLEPSETAYVEIVHKNPQAATGSYDISFGKPLPGEFAVGASVFLPLVVR